MPPRKKKADTSVVKPLEKAKRKRRKKAEMPPKVTVVTAVYTLPTKASPSRPVCPVCYSNPSVKGRYDKVVNTSERKWHSERDDFRVGKQTYVAYKSLYPCSNPNCHTYIYVSISLSYEAVYPPKRSFIDSTRYFAGTVGRDGVWTGPQQQPNTRSKPQPNTEVVRGGKPDETVHRAKRKQMPNSKRKAVKKRKK